LVDHIRVISIQANHNYRTTGIVNTFTKQILTEAALLAFSTSLNDFNARPPSAFTALDYGYYQTGNQWLPATYVFRYAKSLQAL